MCPFLRLREPRDLWFRKSEVTDTTIRTRFGADVEAALAGERDDWADGPRGSLALVLLLDQFTRNIFRDTPRAFAGDAQALGLAQRMVARGDDHLLAPVERRFIYLPFVHAESLPMQDLVLTEWAERCERAYPNCKKAWNDTIGTARKMAIP